MPIKLRLKYPHIMLSREREYTFYSFKGRKAAFITEYTSKLSSCLWPDIN